MNLQELKLRVNVKKLFDSYNRYLVTIVFREKKYSCFSNNSLAYDRICCSDDIADRVEHFFYTLKNAYLTFYDECKAKNGLKIKK